MEDRDVEPLRHVARVVGGAALRRQRREADLVVRDDVQRAARAVAIQLREVERLCDHALPRERGVAVDQDRHHGVVVARDLRCGAVGLLRARDPFRHRVDRLEVARIGREQDVDRAAGRGRVRAFRAQMVLHVAGRAVAAVHPFELGDNGAVGPPEHVDDDVEPAAVRHAEHDLARAGGGRPLDRQVEHRHQHVGPLDGEPFRSQVRAMDELLERLDFRQPLQQTAPRRRFQRVQQRAGLDLLPQPLLPLRILQVLVLEANGARVGRAQPFEHVVHEHRRAAIAQVRFRKAVEERVERGMPARLAAQRIQVRGEVAVEAVRLDEFRRGPRGAKLRRVGARARRSARRCRPAGRRRPRNLGRRDETQLLRRLREGAAPRLVHRIRVAQPPLVELLRVACVVACEPISDSHVPSSPKRCPVRRMRTRARATRSRRAARRRGGEGRGGRPRSPARFPSNVAAPAAI